MSTLIGSEAYTPTGIMAEFQALVGANISDLTSYKCPA